MSSPSEDFARKHELTGPFALSKRSRRDECQCFRETLTCALGHKPRFYQVGMVKPGHMRVCTDFKPLEAGKKVTTP
jgi:hypothetical protein